MLGRRSKCPHDQESVDIVLRDTQVVATAVQEAALAPPIDEQSAAACTAVPTDESHIEQYRRSST